jgi:hypothetical protein
MTCGKVQRRKCRSGMSWFRRNVRAGSWCGLLALTLQLVLSFGHIHGPLPSSAPAPAVDQSVAIQSAVHRSATSQAVAGRFEIRIGHPDRPAPPVGFGFNDCPICALTQLVSAAVPAGAPPLWTPVASLFVQPLRAEAAFSFGAPPHSIFQARAPPAA